LQNFLNAAHNSSQYVGEVCPSAHISELCLHSLPARGLGNRDEHHSRWSQSCEIMLVTSIGDLAYLMLEIVVS